VELTSEPGTFTTIEEQAITMTRSLGDFYAHEYGVTHKPEVIYIYIYIYIYIGVNPR